MPDSSSIDATLQVVLDYMPFGFYDDAGGEMYNTSSSPVLTDCTFSDNSSGGEMSNSRSSPMLLNCTFPTQSDKFSYSKVQHVVTNSRVVFTLICPDVGLIVISWLKNQKSYQVRLFLSRIQV